MRDRVTIKAEAKQIIRTAQVSPLVITAIVIVICLVLDRLVDLVRYGTPFYSLWFQNAYVQALLSGDSVEQLEGLLLSAPEAAASSFFFTTLVSLFTLILNGGYYIYCMGIRQGLHMPYATLADGLAVAGKLIWCWFQMSVKIFLWSLLFVVPGIIAAYRYTFAYYNVLTDSSLSAGDAIRLSCRQTRGIKGDLFMLDLSFLGWNLLSYITMGLADIWVTPYQVLCHLAYFEDAQRRLGRAPYGGSSSSSWEMI